MAYLRSEILHGRPLPKHTVIHDLNHPDFNPPDCPPWAREEIPDEMLPYRGRNGMPESHRHRPALALNVRGVDRYHANQFLVHRPETEDFLANSYTPHRTGYVRGLLPGYEALVEACVRPQMDDQAKALALLRNGVTQVKHPLMPPCGPYLPTDRNADDEELLSSGVGWCNEQARVFVRLCQVAGLPARIVQLFYADNQTGHCVAEFRADGRWCMADASWFCVFPNGRGGLLSAAECHDRSEGQMMCGNAYFQRFQELMALSDQELNSRDPEFVEAWRKSTALLTPKILAEKMGFFAVINYPLPRL